jgi:hypothetical protein
LCENKYTKIVNKKITLTGMWRDGMQDGPGRLSTNSGDVYEGNFIRNELTGKANVKYSNGHKYCGVVCDWQPHGSEGKMTFSNGDVYEG